jgi:hypothetical protein
VSTLAPRDDGNRKFVLALAVAFATMVLVSLTTLYLLGSFAAPGPEAAVEAAPTARPTAVWKFRAEWQKPEQP